MEGIKQVFKQVAIMLNQEEEHDNKDDLNDDIIIDEQPIKKKPKPRKKTQNQIFVIPNE